VAREVGIDRFEAELRPAEKASWLTLWRAHSTTTDDNATVGMVGDGVNDAPALASADVGLALGGVGSDLAADAGDLVILGSPLAPLPGLLLLARQTVQVIYENIIIFAFFVNILGIVLTAWIMPTWSAAWAQRAPVAAALFHQVGSVLVLLNAMRLLWFERWASGPLGRAEQAMVDAWSAMIDRLQIVEHGWRWASQRRVAVIGSAAVVAVIAYLATGLVAVAPDEVASLRRCGRLLDVLEPGLHVCLPWPWDSVTRHRAYRVATVEIGMRAAPAARSEVNAPGAGAIEWNSPHRSGSFERLESEAVVLTGDHSLVEVGAAIQYRIIDLPRWLYGVRDPEAALRTLAESALREVAATHPVVDHADDRQQREILTTGRRQVESQIARRLQDLADRVELGIEVLDGGVCLQEVHPPLDVVPAFRDVSSAFKERGRMLNEADADYRKQVILAAGKEAWQQLAGSGVEVNEALWQKLHDGLAGEAAAELLAAEAFATTRENAAAGEAAQFVQVLRAAAGAPDQTRWRAYIEMMSTAMRDKKKLILDRASKGRRHLLLGVGPSLDDSLRSLLTPQPEPPGSLPRED
jgi:Cu+-exporting ATPase